ncbi:response regulator transcription factor [Murimonas intestini]|uniref:Stage 0 sporulation protein A homolog n=1 Tax=Murimonas intestini TaxID=1337051 RepID=A0AB73T353_9FIRM|nr:response regulator transcription factor [Murimonas intestini]MCR1841478.1 response regulator transcription factor [Murimonas intestini]MCR1866984.1 response regulator transcription factor [Murimonas intestini]MCR1884007.1 response regulator transcription factor [Murimonas intestini]
MRVLIIEDDEKLCESLSFQLEKEKINVDVCHDGEDGLHFIREQAHDVILLDRMIPLIDGLRVLGTMRAEHINTPVILVTALGELNDRITGLDCGADDYIVKPFAFQELMARIRSICRRPRTWESSSQLTFGDILYDAASNQLFRSGNCICTLSKREGTLLELFLRNPGQILPRNTILTKVWGPDAGVEDGNLDNYIHFIRRRLKQAGSTLSLKTVRGVGYCLEEGDV